MRLGWLWMLVTVAASATPTVIGANSGASMYGTTASLSPSVDEGTDATADSSKLCVHTSRPNHECVPTESCNETSRVESLQCDAEDSVCCAAGQETRVERESVNSAVTSGLEQLQQRDKLEKVLVTKNLTVKPYTSEGMYNEYMNSEDKALDAERNSFVMVQAVKYLSYKVPKPNDVSDAVQRFMDGDQGSLDDLFSSFDLPIGDQLPPEMQSQLGIKGGGVGGRQSLNSANMTSEGNSGDFEDGQRESQTRRGRSHHGYEHGGRPEYECMVSKYRSIDGSCNNLNNPDWGRAFRVYSRLLSAKYSDGVASPRLSYDGSYLPSARLVSTTICTDEDHINHDNTLMSMQWGQFVDHEMGFTPIYKVRGTHGILCCAKEIYENPHLLHPECFPIPIPDDDPFYRNHYGEDRTKCLEFVRSLTGPTGYGDKYGGKRQQLNQVSSFLDGSVIYGSSHRESSILRSFNNGQLKAIYLHGKEYVPQEVNPECTDPSLCHRVISGDSRANQHPWLTVLHNVFLRAHNYFAYELHQINPHWDDEYLYQEARRIINAQMQHITYNEFLPSFFGYEFLKQYGLDLKRYGYSNDYDEYINPTSLNEFTASAFRVGHSLIHGTIEYRSREYGDGSLGKLREHYFSPHEILENGIMDKYILSLLTQWPQRADVWITKEVTNYLFKAKNESHGLDLISLNIQRGRDHGLQPYNDYRKLCGLNKAYSFEDLYPSIDKPVIEKLKYLYKTVNDIDLYVGGIAEKHNRHALLGPTFACIIANQFRRVKRGDRFWYEMGYQPHSFTPDQLQEIRRTSLGSLICHFSDRIEYVQKFVFKQPYNDNPVAPCNDFSIHQRPDLRKWRQASDNEYGGSGQPAYGGPAYDQSEKEYEEGPYDKRASSYGGPADTEHSTQDYASDSNQDPDKVYITEGSYEGPASKVKGYYGGGPGYGPGGPGKYKTQVVTVSYDSGGGETPINIPINVPDVDKMSPSAESGGDSHHSESSYKSELSYDSTIPSETDGLEGDEGKSGPYPRAAPYGGYAGADKSLYANYDKSAYDSSYKADSDSDKYKSSYYDSDASSYDKYADTYDSKKDSYDKKAYDRKYDEKDYYDKDKAYGDRKYTAYRRYYASKYGSNKGYEDSVYSADKYSKYAAKSDHKEYDAAADKKSSSYDASAYAAKSYADSASKSKDASYKSSEHDDKYKASSKASYDSDDSYKASEKYETPPTYYDSGYKGPAYDSSYKGSDYNSGYKGSGPAYDSTYKGSGYDSGYKGSDYDSSYKGSDYDSGYKAGGYDSGYKGPAYDSSYKGSDYDSGYKGPAYDSNKGSGYDSGYKGPAYDSTNKGSGYDSGNKGSDYDSSYKGSGYDSGYKGSDYDSTYKGSGYDSGYKGSDYDSSYKGGDYDSGYKGPRHTSYPGYKVSGYYSGYKDSDSGYKGGSGYDSGYKGSGPAYDSSYKGSGYDSGYKGSDYDSGYKGSGYYSGYKGSSPAYDSSYKGSGYDSGYKGPSYDSGYKGSDYDSSYKGSGSSYYPGYKGSGSSYYPGYKGSGYSYYPGYKGSGSSYDSGYYGTGNKGGYSGYAGGPSYDSSYSAYPSYDSPSYDSSYKSGYYGGGGGSKYGYGYDQDYSGGYDPSYGDGGGSSVVYESGYSGGSSYGGPNYESGYAKGTSYGKPTYETSYSSGYKKPSYGYKSGYKGYGYPDRYTRSHNDTDGELEDVGTAENGTESDIIKNKRNINITETNEDGDDESAAIREERSYGAGGYYAEPSYDASAYYSKSAYDSADTSSADYDKTKSNYKDSQTRYYDKEKDKYGNYKDSYYSSAYGKKHSEADYYDKDTAYRDRKYGAHKRYYSSAYGSKKGYEDSVYSADKYSKKHAASDHKEYDAAADKKASSYDSSAYSAKYKADDYDKKTDSSYYDKESDSYYKANKDSSYYKSADVQKESKPTYTAPAPSYDSTYDGSYYGGGKDKSYDDSSYSGSPSYGYGYGGSPGYGKAGYNYGGGYDKRYPRSHEDSETNNGTVSDDASDAINGTVDEVTLRRGRNSDEYDIDKVSDGSNSTDIRPERSYGQYGYAEPSYDESAYVSKSAYDSADKSSSDYDKSKSSYSDSDVRYYDKEADRYGSRADSYDAAAYAKKYSEADYYNKDVAYRDRKYGANKRYYASNYGAKKGYEDSVYSSDRYSKLHAAADRKEYDAAADKKASSYDSSAYSAKYKADEYDKKTDSSYYDKESDSYYKANKDSSYYKTADVMKESKPTYTAPSYDSYGDSSYGYGQSKGYGGGGYDQRYPRSHSSQENATSSITDQTSDDGDSSTVTPSAIDQLEEITTEE